MKEVRAWRHRFWWLPIAGALFAILPMAFASPPSVPSPETLRNPWAWSQVMFSTIPAGWLAGVSCALGLCAMALSAWLARTLRWSEIHDDTLTDVSLTRITAFEMTAGQVLTAWVITLVTLMGAMPVLLFYSAMAGKDSAQVAIGSIAMILCPLFTAVVGYSSMWWRKLTSISVRGKSYGRFLVWFAPLLIVLCIALAWFPAYHANKWASWIKPSGSAQGKEVELGFRTVVTLNSFFWGLPVVCLLYVILGCALAMWRRGPWGRLALVVVLFCVLGGSIVPARAATRWASSLTSQIGMPAIFPEGFGVLAGTAFWAPFGASFALGGQWGNTQFSNDIEPYVLPGIGIGLGYWLIVALAAFVFAVGDLGWTMKNSWAIAALQNPARAMVLAPEAERVPRFRRYFYPFATRNPVFDLCLARSSSTRAALAVIFGLGVIGLTGFFNYYWKDFAKSPIERWRFSDMVGLPMAVTFLLSACCGWSCGLTITRLKKQRQWPALLATPLKLRTLILGVCLPRWIDGVMVLILFASVAISLFPLRLMRWDEVGGMALLSLAALLISSTSSIFSSAFTKSPAKTGFLAIVVSGMVAAGFILLGAWLQERYFPHSFGPYPRPWWNMWVPFIASLIAVAVTCLVLLWLGCRRLRWDR